MVIVVTGVSGSGKSTVGRLLAKQLGCGFYDADDFHSDANKSKMASGHALTDEDRSDWLMVLQQLIMREIEADQHMVLACSALKESYRDQLKVNEQVQFVYLRGTLQQIEARMQARSNHYMKPNMLKSQFEILEEPVAAVVVDITNTPEEIVSILCRELNP